MESQALKVEGPEGNHYLTWCPQAGKIKGEIPNNALVVEVSISTPTEKIVMNLARNGETCYAPKSWQPGNYPNLKIARMLRDLSTADKKRCLQTAKAHKKMIALLKETIPSSESETEPESREYAKLNWKQVSQTRQVEATLESTEPTSPRQLSEQTGWWEQTKAKKTKSSWVDKFTRSKTKDKGKVEENNPSYRNLADVMAYNPAVKQLPDRETKSEVCFQTTDQTSAREKQKKRMSISSFKLSDRHHQAVQRPAPRTNPHIVPSGAVWRMAQGSGQYIPPYLMTELQNSTKEHGFV